MRGTTSFCDELTGDIGGAFEATSIDGCRLFCRLAEIQSHGVLGLLQHNQGEERTSSLRGLRPAFDPGCVKTLKFNLRGEILSWFR